MRQLKTFMRNRKKEMLACGPCECRTLQCWRYANENCGCGENSNNRFFAFNGEGENKTFFFFNMNLDEDNTINIEVDPDAETGDSKVVIWEFWAIKNEEARALWIGMWEDLDAECVETLLGGSESSSWSWRFKAETMAQFNAFINNPTEEQMGALRGRLEHQCWDDEPSPIIEKVSDNCIIYFAQQSGIWNPKTGEGEEVKSDYVNLSKKSVAVPVWTLMKIEYSEDDKDVYFIFYDENETEIDRVVSRAPSDTMQYIYYAEEGSIEYGFEWDEERGWNIVKSSVEVQVFWGAVVLMQVTIAVEPEWWGTTNYKKLWVAYDSQRTAMTTVQGTWYFKISDEGREFIISASPNTSIEKNRFGDWKVNDTWAWQTSDHRIRDNIVITAVFTDSER